MAFKGSKKVTITGAADKRNITATIAVTLSGKFLPIQLMYGGKTEQGLPRYKFPDSFFNEVIISSIDKWAIRTVLSLFIFLLRKRFHANKNTSDA